MKAGETKPTQAPERGQVLVHISVKQVKYENQFETESVTPDSCLCFCFVGKKAEVTVWHSTAPGCECM